MNKSKYVILGVVIFAILFFGGYLVFRSFNNHSIKESWSEEYYIYLIESRKNKEENTIPSEAQNTKIKFVDRQKEDKPLMVISYKVKENTYTNLYYIENNKVKSYIYEQPTTLELLYNLKKDEYNYYIHSVKEQEDSFNSLDNTIGEEEYIFPHNEDGDLTNYNSVFIEPNISDNFTEFNYNADEKELKNIIKQSIDMFTTKDKLITKEVKDNIAEKIREQEAKMLEDIFNKLDGTWYNKSQNIILNFSSENNKKEFTYATFATEQGYNGEMTDIKLEDNIYSFLMNDQNFEVDITNIDKKEIKVNEYTFVFVHKDFTEAGNIIFEKYFY